MTAMSANNNCVHKYILSSNLKFNFVDEKKRKTFGSTFFCSALNVGFETSFAKLIYIFISDLFASNANPREMCALSKLNVRPDSLPIFAMNI